MLQWKGRWPRTARRSAGEPTVRVGIDAHMVGGQETGNETYVKGIVDGFKDLAQDVDILVFNVGTPWTAPQGRIQFQRLITGNPLMRLGVELPLRSMGQHLDLLHMTYAAPAWSAAPLVLTVHDICYTTNPEWFSSRDLRVLSTMVPRSIRKAAHVITDSQDARRQIIEHYRVPATKISAIPIGAGAGAEPIALDAAREELSALGLNLDRPFILAVGNLQPRKNLVRLLDAFGELVAHRGHDIDLVIVGPRRYRAHEIISAAGSVTDRVHFTGYVTDRQLAAFYRCSTVFVLPSLYEGFGLPALEAMAQGVPIACSDAGALPEVCGDAAIMFNPKSVESIAAAVERILGDAELRRRLSLAGTARATMFSWKKTAELTLKVYEQVVKA
jgi:glycosyltransferase involved in cell wall biosynthesis